MPFLLTASLMYYRCINLLDLGYYLEVYDKDELHLCLFL